MRPLLLLFLLTLSTTYAAVGDDVGQVTRVLGEGTGHIRRAGKKIPLAPDLSLALGDVVSSEGALVVVHIYPGTQVSLSKNTEIKLSEHQILEEKEKIERSFSVIDYVKGLLRVQVDRDTDQEVEQQVRAEGVSFGVRGTEFEVSDESGDVELDVIEGEVTASSPYIQSFVPEIVKTKEGLRFNRRKKAFERRKFQTKFTNHPGFRGREEILKAWKMKRQARREKRTDRRQDRRERQRKAR